MNNVNRINQSSDRSRGQTESIQNRVMKSVSDYNRQLNQERKDDRRVCMDLQTYTIQYPVGLGRDNKGLRRWMKRRRKIQPLWRSGRRYPVALMPTQYQDWYLSYTPQELKYLPLNTVVHGPIPSDYDKLPLSCLPALEQSMNNLDSDFDGSDVLSDLDDDSVCSCGELHCSVEQKNVTNEIIHNETPNINSNLNDDSRPFGYNENSCLYSNGAIGSTTFNDLNILNQINSTDSKSSVFNGSCVSQNIDQKSAVCKQCTREVAFEEALFCADCGISSHPSCLDISGELLNSIRLYKWQCMDCKSCNQCGQQNDEDQMLFCDKCDRGFHTYCLGLSSIPDGHWVCTLCAICANCGTKKPNSSNLNSGEQDSSNKTAQWQHELIKIHSPDGQTLVRHQVFCEACYQLRKL